MKDDASRILAACNVVFDQPPRAVPNWHSADGPLMGNGDLGVVMGMGPVPGMHQFWLSKNDFWRLSGKFIRGEERCSPKTFGTLNVTVPGLAESPYRVVQKLVDAQTVATLAGGGSTLTMRSWVAATRNLLVIEFTASGKPVDVKTGLWVKPERSTTATGCEGGVHWATRKFEEEDVVLPVGAAAAVRRLDSGDLDFTVSAERPVTLVLAMQSSFKCEAYRDESIALAGRMNTVELEVIRAEHAAWWLDFWAQSLVEFDDPAIMHAYYLSQYVMGSASRDPEFPPPLFGVWATTDNRAWSGDYHLNYNHQAPFYALYKSNHIEQADPFHAPVLDYMEKGAMHARTLLGCRGLYYPVGIGPKGADTTGWMPEWEGTEGEYPHHRREYFENGREFYRQRSNAAYCVVNIAMRWYHTYDVSYAETLYPFVRGVAEFWEDYLKFEPFGGPAPRPAKPFDASRGETFHPPRVGEGRYVIYNDQIQETSSIEDFNPILSLGLVPMVCELALDMSEALDRDQDRRAKWRHIIRHMSTFCTQSIDGKTVFRYTERGEAWCPGNTLGIQHIYPSGAIGPDSSREWLAISRNTIEVMNRWQEGGGGTSLYPAAARVGYAPATILKKLGELIKTYHRTNGLPAALEDCGTVPNTINEMLCMSHRQVLRVFQSWPRDRDARFRGLRAEGAFLVSSALKGGEVQFVQVLSEQGRPCTLVNPWPGKAIDVYRDGRKVETLKGERVVVETDAGATVVFGPEGMGSPASAK